MINRTPAIIKVVGTDRARVNLFHGQTIKQWEQMWNTMIDIIDLNSHLVFICFIFGPPVEYV